jgi:hypothetical protein
MATAHPSSASMSGTATAGFRVRGSGFGVQGSGFRVQGSGVQASGFRVQEGQRWEVVWCRRFVVTEGAAHVPQKVDARGRNVCDSCSHRVAGFNEGLCYVPAHPCGRSCHQDDGFLARLQALDPCQTNGGANVSGQPSIVANGGRRRGGERGVDLRRELRWHWQACLNTLSSWTP